MDVEAYEAATVTRGRGSRQGMATTLVDLEGIAFTLKPEGQSVESGGFSPGLDV